MFKKRNLYLRLGILFLVLLLIIPVLAACDDDDDDNDKTPTQSATTQTDTGKKEPVKLGIIGDWSGANAVCGMFFDQAADVVKYQVEQQGGILGGRPVEFIKVDTASQPAKALAGWVKFNSEGVSAVVAGGCSEGVLSASSDTAGKYGIPLFNSTPFPDPLSDYEIRGWYPGQTLWEQTTLDFIRYLAPKTITVMSDEGGTFHDTYAWLKKQLEPDGIKIVNEQYIPIGTADYTPYATKALFDEADLLVASSGLPNFYKGIFDVAMERGWGNTKFLGTTSAASFVASHPGAEGTYAWTTWTAGTGTVGEKNLQQLWQAVHGEPCSAPFEYVYCTANAALAAIELAGSAEPGDIYQAAKSGNLQFESPVGLLTWDTDGENNSPGVFYQVVNGQLQIVDDWQ